MTASVLEIEQLRLSLPGAARPVLDGVDLTVAAGETVALVGESGSGKTLTSRAALGLLPPGAVTSGAVRVAGDDVLAMDAERLRRVRARTAAMVFQDPRAAINPLRRIGDFLTEGLRAEAGRARRAERRGGFDTGARGGGLLTADGRRGRRPQGQGGTGPDARTAELLPEGMRADAGRGERSRGQGSAGSDARVAGRLPEGVRADAGRGERTQRQGSAGSDARAPELLLEGMRADTGRGERAPLQGGADPDARAAELLDAVGLSAQVMRRYPHELSGGMLQRVMIAGALMAGPRLLLADEPTTALDVTTQAEIVALLAGLRERFGTGLLFVTHDLELAAAISDRVYVMYAGRIAESGPAGALFGAPGHPYTAALLSSTPRLEAPPGHLPAIPGRPPDLRTELPGCAFAPRCAHATDRCGTETPALRPLDAGTVVACHHAAELTLGEGATP
ncbi:ABC transporter ATP-binding protein [Streptomyces sp. NBC_01304]|uniref:ABC transporter ATP-binding protein n=1 Tax=Streptomyces sp. NBC_01304 TaxID=2903818 RepID=UPI002E11858C|nr:ABC transporter ATP-binding protein [Streptomyces sp. NBC_01304]